MYLTVERSRLLGVGVTDAVIRKAVGCCLHRLCQGVYMITRRCPRPEHAAVTAVLPPGWAFPDPGAMPPYRRARLELATRIEAARGRLLPAEVFSHFSAAHIHGLPLSGPVPRHAETSRIGRSKHRALHHAWGRESITAEDVTTAGGLPVTSLARTIVDVARTHAGDVALAMADHAARLDDLTSADLERAIERSGYVKKLSAPRTVCALVDGRRESAGESRTAFICHGLGIEGLVPQHVIVDGQGRFVARADFADPVRKIIVEFDGLAKYGMHEDLSRRDVLEREKFRQERLMALGWAVIRLTWSDLNSPARYLSKLAPLL